MENTKQTKKVVISTRAVYHKYAEVTIEVPSNINDEDMDEYLSNNYNFSKELAQKLGEAEFETGFGLNDNMTDFDEENETRFDVYNSKGEVTWGCHC